MKLLNSGTKRLLVSLVALGALGGCVAVPYDPGYGYYAQPAYPGAAVYVAPPVVNFGFQYGGYYGHRHGGWGGHGGRR